MQNSRTIQPARSDGTAVQISRSAKVYFLVDAHKPKPSDKIKPVLSRPKSFRHKAAALFIPFPFVPGQYLADRVPTGFG